jgi:preprotein translocase subunit SecB
MSSQDNAPRISINAQYVKDLSFESPGAPNTLTLKGSPAVDLGFDIHVTRLAEDEEVFEVALHIEASAAIDGKVLFITELVYAGVFTLTNFQEEERHIVLAVHCPSMIFPFARKIVADATQDGGFQPLMLDPIDFGALYQSKIASEEGGDQDGN